MDWPNERYVRLYTRDSVEWLSLSWHAQGLLCLILRKCDRSGVIDLGRVGVRGLSALVKIPMRELNGPLNELVESGMIELSKSAAVVPNFVVAQEAVSSGAQRTRLYRERRASTATRDATSQVCDATSQVRDATSGNDATSQVRDATSQVRDATLPSCVTQPSQPVTPSLAEPSLTMPNLAEEARADAAPARQQIEHDDPQVLELAEAIAAQEMFAGIDALDVAGGAIHLVQGGRLRLPWLVAAVGDCAGSARAARAAGQPWSKTHSADRLMRYLRKARRQDIAPKVDVMTEMKNGSYGAERAVDGANQHSPGLAAWIAQQGSGAEQSPIDGGGDGVAAIAELARSFGGRKS